MEAAEGATTNWKEFAVDNIIAATVEVAVTETGAAFACPKCGKKISYANRYPLNFHWKVCKRGCRLMWMPDLSWELGPRREELAGQTVPLRIFSTGRSV